MIKVSRTRMVPRSLVKIDKGTQIIACSGKCSDTGIRGMGHTSRAAKIMVWVLFSPPLTLTFNQKCEG